MPPLHDYLVTLSTTYKQPNISVDTPCLHAINADETHVVFSLHAACQANFMVGNSTQAGVYPVSLAVYEQQQAYHQDIQALIAEAKKGAVRRDALDKTAINIDHKSKQDPEVIAPYVIVLDPGHGGGDSGAGGQGVMEKELVLSIAKKLQQALIKRGHYSVYLTRDTDAYVTLADRVRYAEQHHADLLLSLHVDQSVDSRVRGYCLYTLSESGAAWAATKQLVAPDSVQALRLDLEQLTTTLASMRFADTLDQALATIDHAHCAMPQWAGFTVLQSATVPSVLVELGFLSNSIEAKRLSALTYQVAMVDAMANAVDSYFTASHHS